MFVRYSGRTKPIAFVSARIIPIVGQPIEQGIMIVQNGKIQAVGDARTVRLSSDVQIIDVKGKVIMPGLVDTHSHVGEGSGADGFESDSAGRAASRRSKCARVESSTRAVGRHHDR